MCRSLALALRGSSERTDLYLASHHHTLANGEPALRVLFRLHDGAHATDGERPDLSPTGHSLDLWMARGAVAQSGGQLSVDANADATVVLIDLPAPS